MIKNTRKITFGVLIGCLVLIILINTMFSDSESVLLPNVHAKTQNKLHKLPDFSKIKNVKEKKQAFFDTLYPIIAAENRRVLKLREAVQLLQSYSLEELTDEEITWLGEVSAAYKVSLQVVDEKLFTDLLSKIDYIPPSLALSQAAIESGWGSSRFSRKGNNLFGHWCFKKGCGMVPSSRDSDKAHEVKKFADVNAAVRAYVQNLNVNESFLGLRNEREKMRKSGKRLTGLGLVKTLTKYSEEGELYVSKLTKFITYNKLQRYTKKFEKNGLVPSS